MRNKPSFTFATMLIISVIPLLSQERLSPDEGIIRHEPADTLAVTLPEGHESPGISLQPGEKEMVQYSPGFEFNDGIYANFEMVKANRPIPPARLVSDYDMFDRAFFEKVTSEKEIVLYDRNGVKQVMKTAEIWGYARNGVLYVNVANSFHRISFVGAISHFVASITTYNPNYYDPYYYNPYSPYSHSYNRYPSSQSNYSSTDLRQYLLNFSSGEIMEYTTESVGVLLMSDPELADEFQSLRNRKKKQMKFVFIRRFNERHPLYFPVYDKINK